MRGPLIVVGLLAGWPLLGVAGAAPAASAAVTPAASVAASAVAQDGERVAGFKVDAVIQADGSLSVVETIDYVFGTNVRHGIERELDLRERYDDERDRLYGLADVQVESPTGAPAGVQLIDTGTGTTVRVGDPDNTVTGRHSYRLSYVLTGLMNSFDDHDELFWEVTGTRWRVPLDGVAATVRAPGGVQRVECFAGDPDSRDACGTALQFDDQLAEFGAPTLPPGSGMTVVVGLGKDVVDVPPPVLEAAARGPWDSPPSPLSYLVAAVAVIGVAGGGWLLWLRGGRDRMFAGVPLGLLPAPGQGGAERFVPLVGRPEPAVAFTPPKEVRPALAGVLLDERPSPVHVSATIVDLAVRGYLRIDKLNGRNWRLTWLGTPRPDDRLAGYEQTLLDALFQGRPSVTLSELNTTFRPRYLQVARELADEAFHAGWFRRPLTATSEARTRVIVSRVLFALVAVPLVFGGASSLLALFDAGWSAVVMVFGTVVALVIGFLVWREMPARTAVGTAVLAQTEGFRRYLATAEADQLRTEEAADVFSRYLPLAMVFGLTERWAKVFAQLAAAQGTVAVVAWYGGGHPGSLGSALDDFGRSTGSAVSSSPASSAGSSGFSGGSVGGGGGGGGGGSW